MTTEGERADLVLVLEACYNDPLLYITTFLGDTPRAWQAEVCDAIKEKLLAGERHIQLHIRTCHTSGKTWLSSRLVHWWQGTRPGARTITTAPNQRLIEKLLWTELRAAHAHAAPEVQLGRMLTLEWQTGGDDDPLWFAIGASSDKPEGIEGQHSWAMCRVVDEAKAVDDRVFTATEGAFFGSEETLDIWISTPSIRQGKFYERDMAGDPRVIRKVVTIEDLIRSGMPGAERAKELALTEYGGEENFEYRSRAMAEYIEAGEGIVFPFAWIERATRGERFNLGMRPQAGWDIAGSVAGDQNVLSEARGPDSEGRFEIGAMKGWHEYDTMKSKDIAMQWARDIGATILRGDVQGLGKGALDQAARDAHDRRLALQVATYRAADPPRDVERFLNRKAEDVWGMRMLLQHDKIRLPNRPELVRDMSKIQYEIRQGKIRIIDPDDSPDWFDSVLVAIGSSYTRLEMKDVSAAPADFPTAGNPYSPRMNDSRPGWGAV